jgi:hypothetical protein
MRLYVSKTGDVLNKKRLDTENISEYICLTPKYPKVSIGNENIKILMDSGAFQDTEQNKRVSFDVALSRQLEFEKIISVVSERIVAYDFIDNKNDTMIANKYLIGKRRELAPRQLVLMVQGANITEYKRCAQEVIEIASPQDCIGFGGVAMAGRVNSTRNKLWYSIGYSIPLLYQKGINNIHIFGVGTFDVLNGVREVVNFYCDKNNIPRDYFIISTDTSAFEIRSTMGSVVNVERHRWEKKYKKSEKYIKYHPCDLAIENIKAGISIIQNI